MTKCRGPSCPTRRRHRSDVSLNLLDAVHRRWSALLERLDPSLLRREYLHPDSGSVTLEQMLGMYAWHGRHHPAHVGLVVGTE